jgi:hypothetical protein
MSDGTDHHCTHLLSVPFVLLTDFGIETWVDPSRRAGSAEAVWAELFIEDIPASLKEGGREVVFASLRDYGRMLPGTEYKMATTAQLRATLGGCLHDTSSMPPLARCAI